MGAGDKDASGLLLAALVIAACTALCGISSEPIPDTSLEAVCQLSMFTDVCLCCRGHG